MAFAFKRSIRQAISFVLAAVAAFGTWTYTREARLFSGFSGEMGTLILPGACAAGAFFLGFYVAMMLLKSKAAR